MVPPVEIVSSPASSQERAASRIVSGSSILRNGPSANNASYPNRTPFGLLTTKVM